VLRRNVLAKVKIVSDVELPDMNDNVGLCQRCKCNLRAGKESLAVVCLFSFIVEIFHKKQRRNYTEAQSANSLYYTITSLLDILRRKLFVSTVPNSFPSLQPPPATIASLLRKRHKHRRKIPETSVRFTLREYETKNLEANSSLRSCVICWCKWQQKTGKQNTPMQN